MKNNKGFKIPLAIPYLSVMLIAFACTKEELSVSDTSQDVSIDAPVGDAKISATATSTSSMRIEAEAYTKMSGVVLDACSEGGKNVGGIQAGDYMEYSVNVPAAGSYKMNFRVAGPGGQFQVRNAAGTVLATITATKTSGYQVYTTVSADVKLASGQQTIRLYAVTGGYNINWFEIVSTTTTVDSPTEPVTSGTVTPVGSNILYRENFENTTVWPGGLGRETSTSYGFTVASSPVIEGKKAGRFELRDTDEMTRSEVRWPSTFNGTDRWFSFSVYWPSNGMQPDSKGEVFHQTHQTSSTSPPMSMTIKNDRIVAELNGQVLSGVLGQGSGTKLYDLGAVPKDRWVRFVIHYKFSYNTDGLWQIWKDGVQVHNYAGKTIYPPAITSSLPSFKLGIYKWVWAGSTTSDSKLRIMYVDDVRIGNQNSRLGDM